MSATKRTPMVTVLNALLCVCVVLVHVTGETIGRANPESLTYALVSTVNRLLSIGTRGFIMLSALKLTLKYAKSPFQYGRFLLDRVRRIVIPYLIWVVIYYLYFCYNDYYVFNWGQLLRFIYVGDIISPFYFIIIIVQFYLLMPLWRLMTRRVHPVLAIPAAAFFMILCQFMEFPYSDRLFPTYLYYWVTGCYIGANFNRFQAILRDNRGFLFACALCCGLFNGYLRFTGDYSMFSDLVHIFYSTLMHMALLALFDRMKSVPRPVQILNRCSYGIFFIHCLLIYIITDLMNDLMILRLSHRLAIRTVFVLGLSVLLCHLYVRAREGIGKKLSATKPT